MPKWEWGVDVGSMLQDYRQSLQGSTFPRSAPHPPSTIQGLNQGLRVLKPRFEDLVVSQNP